MSYVRELLTIPDGEIEHRIWKHRSYAPENEKFICQGWAKFIDLNIPRDLIAAVCDFLPLGWFARRKKSLIFHAHSRMGFVLALLASKLVARPVVGHMHALGHRPAIYRKLWKLSRAKIIFNSKKTCLHYGCDPATSLVLTPTIPWPAAPQKNEGRGRYYACSSFLGWKHVHVIIEAFKNLRAGDRTAELDIYGLSPEPVEPAYQKRVVQLAARVPSLQLRPWDTAWLKKVRERDIFVHAASAEPFGIAILEAFAKGCKMIVPAGTFLDDLPEPHRSDGVFRLASVSAEDLAEQMKRAAASDIPELWERRRPVAELFSISQTASSLASLYRSLMNPRERF